ncbi:D-alanyl-D-alanine carboxypeptidase/D-alanyl-D-alanine endopeptidase [Amycolatopsis sp. H20-H5]|uniref:D-alanyl-D-alanine carboxypeptidase/D-alanyl-D-alanine endopeptidase n=1 Tax=Amycolatopsis sp. H20-H5 TaxID=3046309 RepID=UPI002DB96CD3|nr:D-alanyl-D-alanine carboxypeptidase/D-alanyl-D-alanine-endopeptidase [Amycolatopsis sp. H20-H5]MEC3980571.1 D-alanyl-D-alanine carboxypeptidase/D-alanyl-D-alanine-endopeptidase [Amycolatopsis sp. H20-H5]
MSVRTRRWALGCAALVLVGLPGAAAADNSGGGGLGQDLDTLLSNPALAGAQTGLVVRDADTGAVLYSRHPESLLQPASNTKLLTSAAALDVLGPDYRFATTVSGDGKRAGSVLAGDLFLKGTGDPTLLAKDYQALAAQVAASGVKTVVGQLVADDTWFDSVRLGVGWAWDDEPYSYNAQISALSVSPDTDYDAGSVIVRVAPGQAGRPAAVTVDPPSDYLKVVNTAVTGSAGSASSVVVDREHGTNTITVAGSIPAGGATDNEYMAVWNPTGFAASVFRKALADNGVRVLGSTAYRATPGSAAPLARRESIPLSGLLVPFLKLSNNMHAEILTKAAGRQVSGHGSWDAGLRALDAKLAGLGVDPAAFRTVDGSGLSRMDSVTTDQFAKLLVAAKSRSWFPAWYNALPVAGNPDRLVGGTLRARMAGTAAANNVHAKTGSLTGVSGLSGYVTAANGEKLVFSLLENNYLGGTPKSVEDAVAVRLATYTGAGDKSQPGLSPRTARVAPADTRRDALECSWVHAC